MLIDSHCHLDYLADNDDLDAVVDRARTAGVGLMLTISTKVGEIDRIVAIAEAYDDVYCTVGVHPHDAGAEGEAEVQTADLIAVAAHPKVVGIGETGLDYFYEHSPKESQQQLFRRHIAAARETGLPLVVHSRDADDDMAAILTEEMGQGAFKGLMHCFSSGQGLADRALALGLYLSYSGIVTFKKAGDLRATARATPRDRLLVETDSPYLAPMPHRGKTNEPALVVHTAAKMAELHDTTPADMATLTGENFFRLFDKIPRPADA